MDSILHTIKKLLGIAEDYDHFDVDLIIHINSVFIILNQIGIGPKDSFSIVDDTAVWSDFIADDRQLESVKSYVYLKVKKIFDPPLSSVTAGAIDSVITELENRLNLTHELSNESGDS